MAAPSIGKPSTWKTEQITSENFVESCGALLFDLTNPQDRKLCIVYFRDTEEWLLAKGRRNQGESRQDAAVREVMEETGHRCHLFPVKMPTRATPPDAPPDFRDTAHVYEGLTEPFACQIRDLKGRTKIIWWYIAALDDPDENVEKLPGEASFDPVFLPLAEAMATLTFQQDRELAGKAINLVTTTLDGGVVETDAPLKGKKAKQGKKKKRPEQLQAKKGKTSRRKKKIMAKREANNVSGV